MDLRSEYALTDADEAWRRRAAEFAEAHVRPGARDADREGRMPAGLVERLGASGLLGATLPRAAGGGDASAVAGCCIAEEIGAVDGSVRGFLAVQAGLVASPIVQFGTPEQKEAWLPGLVSGRTVGAYALTEPGAGSDVGAIATRSVADGKDVVLDGEKVWITNGLSAGVLLVFATSDPALRQKGLDCWIVPGDARGLSREPMPGEALGHRASEHARLVLRGVRIPRANRLGGEREGYRVAMAGLDAGRLNVAAGAVGILRACRDACAEFARTRRQFGHRIGDFQQVGAAIADMDVDLRAARLLTLHAARLRDRAMPTSDAVSVAKLFATEAALRAATAAIQIHGSRAYSDESPVGRHWRDAIALTIYEGTSQIQRLILSRSILGKEEGGDR
jgi:alkylation response protein AidB-like acyl-CoA dehydrogenase